MEYRQAFDQLKAYLASALLLVNPDDATKLLVYLHVSNQTFAAILVEYFNQRRKITQNQKKLVFALIMVAYKLLKLSQDYDDWTTDEGHFVESLHIRGNAKMVYWTQRIHNKLQSTKNDQSLISCRYFGEMYLRYRSHVNIGRLHSITNK